MFLSKIDAYGKAGWLTLILLAFWLAWPVGLAVAIYLVASGRFEAWRAEASMPGRWFNLDSGPLGRARSQFWAATGRRTGSGNAAFDAYRQEVMRGLEEDQREFQEFLERLRQARDKAEFDAFMAERRDRRSASENASGSAN